MFKFELGDIVRDTVSGLEGEVTGRAEYAYGMPRLYEVILGINPCSIWIVEERLRTR